MRASRLLVVAFGTLALVIGGTSAMRAHKPITSKYTYTTDVLPLFRDRCGACHQPDGVGPMSLLTYQDARPWAQSIKDEVVNLRMPPRYAEAGFGPVRNGYGLNARAIDMIVEWTSGGTPEGPRQSSVALPDVRPSALAGTKPDLTFTLPEFTLAKDATEETRSFVIPTGLTSDRFVRGLEVIPGAPAIVRSVVISIREIRNILTVWQPGQDPLALDNDAAYRLPARADLTVRVRYKKTWRHEGQEVIDRTAVRVWLTDKVPHKVIERFTIASSGADVSDQNSGALRFTETVKQNLQVLAVLPDVAATLDSMRVEAVRPDGSRQPMLLLTHPSPDWPTRYWFQSPVTLATGSRIEVVVTPGPSAQPGRLGLQLDYVATNSLDKTR